MVKCTCQNVRYVSPEKRSGEEVNRSTIHRGVIRCNSLFNNACRQFKGYNMYLGN